jgi:hypothetical protein
MFERPSEQLFDASTFFGSFDFKKRLIYQMTMKRKGSRRSHSMKEAEI